MSVSSESSKPVILPFKLKVFICAVWFFILFLRVLGRVKIRGIENLRSTAWENRLLLANHPSFIEPVLITLVGFMPKMVLDSRNHFPWHTPNSHFIEEFGLSFIKDIPFLVPLKTDKNGRPNDAGALRELIRRIKQNTFIIFPEGTRSFQSDEPRIKTVSGVEIGRARDGIGFLIAQARPTVVPILVRNADKVLPPHQSNSLGRALLQIMRALMFYPIEIIFGKPRDFSDFLANKTKIGRETYEELGRLAIGAIADLDRA